MITCNLCFKDILTNGDVGSYGTVTCSLSTVYVNVLSPNRKSRDFEREFIILTYLYSEWHI
jgi:hypothetical protein